MTTVVDSSCIVALLTEAAPAVVARLARERTPVAPHLLDVEVLGSIRRMLSYGSIDRSAATQAVGSLAEWSGRRLGHQGLLERAWELRDSVSAPDAIYVALAETLDAPLITLDARLARAQGPRCEIEVLA